MTLPAILGTCRFIYNEALPVLYGENIFRMDHIDEGNPNTIAITKVGALFLWYEYERQEPEWLGARFAELAAFWGRHPGFKHITLEIDGVVAETSDVMERLAAALVLAKYRGGLTIMRTAPHSKNGFLNIRKVKETVEAARLREEGT